MIVIFYKELYALVNHCHSECPQIACWSAEGKTFVVKDKDEFAKTILPQYFDHNKFSSLVRQLNFYGFSKMQVSQNENLLQSLYIIIIHVLKKMYPSSLSVFGFEFTK